MKPMPATTCPKCSAVLDAHSNVIGSAPPSPGDLSVCAYCGSSLRFDSELQLRLLTRVELALLTVDEIRALAEAHWLVARVKSERLGRGGR